MSITTLPEEEVNIKISSCPTCKGAVRFAVEHCMTAETKKDFYNEVSKHNLNVSTIPLLQYRQRPPKWCSCPNAK